MTQDLKRLSTIKIQSSMSKTKIPEGTIHTPRAVRCHDKNCKTFRAANTGRVRISWLSLAIVATRTDNSSGFPQPRLHCDKWFAGHFLTYFTSQSPKV